MEHTPGTTREQGLDFVKMRGGASYGKRFSPGTVPLRDQGVVLGETADPRKVPSASYLGERQQPAAPRVAPLDEPVALGLDAQGVADEGLQGLAAA